MRLYRALLRLYPASFRDEYGVEMIRAFERQRRDSSGFSARFSLWVGTLVDTVGNAARVHSDILAQDLRQAARTLRRSPGFAVAVILVTALGVGATTAAFTLTDYVLLRPLPFPESERLVKIWQGPANRPATARGLQGTNDVSPGLYLGWRKLSTSFESMGTFSFASSNLTGSADPERLEGANLSASAIETIGVKPAIGRVFAAQDDMANAPCVVLISDGLWRRQFGGEPGAVGSRIRLDEETCEIAGVMPRGFDFPARTTAFWRPIRFEADRAGDFDDRFLRVIARLKRGVSLEAARHEMSGVAAELGRMRPREAADLTAVVIRLRDEMNDQSRMLLLAMAGAAGCLLLIACTNLASLTIARAVSRAGELAVRTALGAGWRRLVRQLLTESVVLSAIGGGAGVLIAIAAIPTAARLVPTALPIAEVPSADLRMLAIAALATIGTGIGFGVLPAFRAARRAAAGDVRETQRTGASRQTTRVRGALVITQVAATIVLLVSAGLLIRALLQVRSTSAGFNTDHVLTVRTFLPWSKYGEQARRTEFYQRVLGDVSRLPGVEAAGYTSYLPLTFRGGIWGVVVPGRPVDPRRGDAASARFVTPDYFRAMGIPLIAGRAFTDGDSPKAMPVAIVSESFVRAYLPGRDPLGTTFEFGLAGMRSIVGVAGDVRVRGLERSSEPQTYLPYQQQGDNRTMGYTPKDLVVRFDSTRGEAESMALLIPAIRRVIQNVDPDQPLSDVQPLGALVEGETVARAVQVRVLGAFAVLSCLLAAIGLHGLLSFVVAARTREFGVRMALGAAPGQILGMVARRGLALGAVGILVGVGAAYAAGRSLESLLAGVSPTDVVTLAVAVALALTITGAGSLLPAIRAARTNPRDQLTTNN